ncbi:hypothetical protein [Dysosmobacter sp. Sow4_B12]|uniref:hypothetical protein n=1 Tax=Dysosmobacter sp. Sow4_B12 TaxID=3438777 RepID=UPI003F8E4EA1
MRISEYDAFGPWVYDVDGEHPLPPLFVPFVDMSKSWRMLLKIPRDIERRRATPDMDLYDFVVGADDAGVQIWSRREKAVESTRIAYRDITGIRLYQRLLHGVCTLYSAGGPVILTYNTVSADVMRRFGDLVRAEYGGGVSAAAGLRGDPDLRERDLDIWLYNQMRDLRDRGVCFTLDAYQPCWSDTRTDRHLPWKRKEEFAGTLYLHNEREVLLLRSGKPEKKGEQTYSAEFTAIPWSALGGVLLESSQLHEGALLASFRLPGAELRTEVHPENRGAVCFLESLAAVI